MKQNLQYLVTIAVDVPEGKECFGTDIGEGIQMGIDYMRDAKELGGEVNKHVVIEGSITRYQSDTKGQPIDLEEQVANLSKAMAAAVADLSSDQSRNQVATNLLRCLDKIDPERALLREEDPENAFLFREPRDAPVVTRRHVNKM